jgi:hypothetical protein
VNRCWPSQNRAGDLNQWKVDIGQELIEFVRSGHTVKEVERLPYPPTPLAARLVKREVASVRETTSLIFWSPVPLVPILAGVSNPHRELCARKGQLEMTR